VEQILKRTGNIPNYVLGNDLEACHDKPSPCAVNVTSEDTLLYVIIVFCCTHVEYVFPLFRMSLLCMVIEVRSPFKIEEIVPIIIIGKFILSLPG